MLKNTYLIITRVRKFMHLKLQKYALHFFYILNLFLVLPIINRMKKDTKCYYFESFYLP